MLHMARDRGVAIDAAVLKAVEEKTWQSGGSERDVLLASNLTDPTPNDSLLLMAQEAAGRFNDRATQIRALRLETWQRADGHWITSDFRPPHSSSLFTTTATAIRALRVHRNWTHTDPKMKLARMWLMRTAPISTEDAAFRLMGVVWSGASSSDVDAAKRDLVTMQKPDGGWAQLPGYESDAYSTGEAVFALHEADTESPEGIRFLIANQTPDGTWHTKSRMISPAQVSPPYFATGFPYERDEFLSYAGSVWATMALLSTMSPETKHVVPKADMGLDAEIARLNASTPWSILERLSSAASFYRNPAVGAMLRAPLAVDPGEGESARVTPLRLAAMSGDLEMVKLLLANGANPNLGGAVSEAVTFGHADVAQALIAAGGETDGIDGSGINLMHWATITNRASLIAVLKDAKVPLNETDTAGFTPLMYAATIDFGETKTLEALLSAGADAGIKNLDGLTPLQQAEKLGHKAIAAVLNRAR